MRPALSVVFLFLLTCENYLLLRTLNRILCFAKGHITKSYNFVCVTNSFVQGTIIAEETAA
jgi:hypothetical protein